MITPITIFVKVRNAETRKMERHIVLPETLDLYNEDDFIVAYHIAHDDSFTTVPGTEFHHVASEWLAQFAAA